MSIDNQVEIVAFTAAYVSSMSAPKVLGNSAVVVLSVIWGMAFVAIRVATFELTPVSLTLARFLIAGGIFFFLLLSWRKMRTRVELKDAPRLLVVSVANVPAYHLSLNYAETSVGAGLAGLLISLGPVFAVILSLVLLKEKPSRRLYLAVSLAIAGAIALSIYGHPASYELRDLLGPSAVIFSALMSALVSVLSKPLVLKYGALPIAALTASVGTAVLLPLLNTEVIGDIGALSLTGWTAVLYLALLSTVFANILLYTLISSRKVSKLSVQFYLVPLVSVFGAIIMLGETPTLGTAVGGGFLLGAVILATAGSSRA